MNSIIRFLLLTAIVAPTTLNASLAFANDSEEVRVHPELELYARDAADQCIPGMLQLRVTVNGVNTGGIMKLELFSGEENFLNKKGKLRRIRVPAEDAPQLICINVPVPGSYAVVGYHDLDGDRRLKKKWDFTPREPYGLSNNPKFESRKRPKYEDSAIDVPSNGIDITIDLIDLKVQKELEKQQQSENN